MRTHGAVVGRRFRSVTKLTTKVRIGRGYLWGSFRIAAAALKTPTKNGDNAQGGDLNLWLQAPDKTAEALSEDGWLFMGDIVWCMCNVYFLKVL